MTAGHRTSGRLKFLLLAALFFGPLIAAAWLYYGGEGLRPTGRSNNGILLEPVENLADALPESLLWDEQANRWLLLYANPGPCGEECRYRLYTLRQSRLMLGKDTDRLERVFLHAGTAPDTLATEYQGMIAVSDESLGSTLAMKTPASVPSGGFYLVDPHGNLVMYFEPDIDPGAMVEDIKHLLRLSRIG